MRRCVLALLVLAYGVLGLAQTPAEFKGHTGLVYSVAFSPDGKLLATAGVDKTVRLWNPADGKEVKNLGGHKEPVYWVAFSPDGTLLASSSNDAMIKIWDVQGMKEQKILAEKESKDPKDSKAI